MVSTMKSEHIKRGAVAQSLGSWCGFCEQSGACCQRRQREVCWHCEGRQERLQHEQQLMRRHGHVDRDPEAWVFVPKGTCERIAGDTITDKLYNVHGGAAAVKK